MLYTVKWPLLYAITHPLGGPITGIELHNRPNSLFVSFTRIMAFQFAIYYWY